MGTPEAMAISSTTLRRRRSWKSAVLADTSVAPICSATDSPPPRSEAMRYIDPRPITSTVPTVLTNSSTAIPPALSSCVPSSTSTARSTANTIPPTASANKITMRVELLRALA